MTEAWRIEIEGSITPETANILEEVAQERARQFQKFGDQNSVTQPSWIIIEGEEFGEVCRALYEYAHTKDVAHLKNLREEWLQVAAVACAAVEALDAETMREMQ